MKLHGKKCLLRFSSITLNFESTLNFGTELEISNFTHNSESYSKFIVFIWNSEFLKFRVLPEISNIAWNIEVDSKFWVLSKMPIFGQNFEIFSGKEEILRFK